MSSKQFKLLDTIPVFGEFAEGFWGGFGVIVSFVVCLGLLLFGWFFFFPISTCL